MDALQLTEPPSQGGTRPAGYPAWPVGRLFSVASVDEPRARLGLRDPLTGLPDRSVISQRLEHELGHSRRDGEGVAALYIDLDHLGHVNEALGHAAGDEVLVRAAERIRRATRAGELVVRLGSDEFVHLCPITGAVAAHARAAKVLEQLDAPLTVQGVEVRLGASIGVAIAPGHGRDSDELLERAHAAMRRAKRAGRNTWAVCTDEDDEASRQRLTLTARLRRALAEDEFLLRYQPVHELATGSVYAVEALVRWQDPGTGLVAPAEFIPHAEESRVIIQIGAWVLEAACRQAAEWRSLGLEPLISINVSPRELCDPGYPDRLAATLARHDVPPQQFMLEVKESAMLGAADVLSNAGALRRLGVSLAIDDFGARDSSLARLRELPARVLKIDRSFLADVPGDARAAAIVKMIATLGRELGMDVVAEGVETRAQLAFAEQAGCRYAQGFHLASALPAAEVTPRLTAAARTRSAPIPLLNRRSRVPRKPDDAA